MLQDSWPTRDEDLLAAEKIMNKHIDFNDGYPLSIFETWSEDNQDAQFQIADWVLEVLEYFTDKYGEEIGSEITQRIVSLSLQGDATIH